MKERPILFSAPMVRALLEGRKTQTRRIVKLPHQNPLGTWEPTTAGGSDGGRTIAGATIPVQGAIWHTRTGDSLLCPYGQPGDRLWVRETFSQDGLAVDEYFYRADGHEYNALTHKEWGCIRWKPSIFMPRFASRILLEITAVRVERLQEITPTDAIAEGVEGKGKNKDVVPDDGWRMSYRNVWESINGPGSWDSNPFVWVVSFQKT